MDGQVPRCRGVQAHKISVLMSSGWLGTVVLLMSVVLLIWCLVQEVHLAC